MAKYKHLGINGGWAGGNKAIYSFLGDDDGTFGAYRDLENYTIVIEDLKKLMEVIGIKQEKNVNIGLIRYLPPALDEKDRILQIKGLCDTYNIPYRYKKESEIEENIAVHKTVSTIKDIIEKLVKKTKEKISDLPNVTSKIEDYYISEKYYDDKGEFYILSLVLSPPTKEEYVRCKNWMISSEVCFPSYNVASKRPLMYEPIEEVIQKLDSIEIKDTISFDLNEMIKERVI